jgi:hypothetical protein|tara:strand:- start:56193 stop:56393 length:201 start_codon:yes stop_codon:yes gene_type:complete
MVEIYSKFREGGLLILGGIRAVWEDKLIIVYVFVAIMSVFTIILLFFFFFIKRLFCEPRTFFKTFQ